MSAKNRSTLAFAIILFVGVLSIGLKNVQLSDPFELKDPYLDGVFPQSSGSPWHFDSVFTDLPEEWEGLLFTRITMIPGTDDFLILGKEGTVWSFEKDGEEIEPNLLLDLSETVIHKWDAGLMDIAFHPEFNVDDSDNEDIVFISYTYQPPPVDDDEPLFNRLSKFEFDDDRSEIEDDSEEIIISQFDRQVNHNGGSMFFDNEGFLYITVGDEGALNDAYNNAQKINKALFSGLLRIDVDMDYSRSHDIRRNPVQWSIPEDYPKTVTQNYLIPNDNPWVSEDGSNLEEFFAIGLRSPHSAHYDNVSEKIFIADVGQNDFEEVNIISKGSNAQWAFKEGYSDGYKELPDSVYGIETPPVFSYGREFGIAVIGGEVYRGDLYPSLFGKYIFGDYGSGNIWSLDLESNETTLIAQVPDTGWGIVDFYVASDGRIYVLKLDGLIYEMKYDPPEEPPLLLSETGTFDDLQNLTPSDGVLPFNVNSPLWSDGASKKRWISLPANSGGITFSRDSSWTFPEGTVFIKHFEMPLSEDSVIRLETRFLVIGEAGETYGLTYKWNENGSDAELIGYSDIIEQEIEYVDDAISIEQSWSFPTRSQCLECHNNQAGIVLGVKSGQLNSDLDYGNLLGTRNQIRVWNMFSFFSENIFENVIGESQPNLTLPKFSNLNDSTSSLDERIRSYLDSNCSHCHIPGGVDAAFNASYSTPLWDQNIINSEVQSRNSGTSNFIIKPNDLAHSELWIRDSLVDNKKMPPLAKNIQDTTYLKYLSEWINSIDPYETHIYDTVCYECNYTFPDGSVVEELTSSLTDTVLFESKINTDSLVITHLEVLEEPLGNIPQQSILVYPNPTSEFIYIKNLTIGDEVQIELVNLAGQNIMSLSSSNGNIHINVSGIASGIYTMRITVNDLISTHKIILD